MPVTLQLAMKLQHLTVDQAAQRLGIPSAEVESACRMLSVSMAHQAEPPLLPGPDDAERAATRANWPMKMQQRYEKGKR